MPVWIGVLAVLVPPTLKWWWGRSLARTPEDPLLPERLQALRRRTAPALIFAAAVLLVIWPSWAVVTIGLLLVLHLAASFPLRRALYQETWSLPAFVWFFVRLALVIYGLWVLIALTPWIVEAAGRFEAIAAVSLALFLVAWNFTSIDVIRRVLRAQPVTDPALNARFDALVAASGVTRPRFEYVAMRGGVLVNAVALPSLGRTGVLMTDTILTRFTIEEVTAICAHEIAHLEYYDRARLRRQHAGTLVMIAAAAAMTPLTRAVVGDIGWLEMIAWPVMLLVALTIRARHRQRNETASDLRAVALTGNAEAMASALARLHTIARMPRRWDRQREQKATHPSLARRIRDIRAHAGTPPPDLQTPVTFRDAGGSMAVTFEPTRVSWQQAPGITQMLNYEALVELRLDVSTSGSPSLVAIDRRQQRWQMTPRAEDLTALQQVLDRVDGRLTPDIPASTFSLTGAAKSAISGLGWIGVLIACQFVISFFVLRGSFSADAGGGLDLPVIVVGVGALLTCALWAFGWFRRGPRLRLQWAVPALFVGIVVVSFLADLGGAALGRDMSVTPTLSRTLLTGPPAAVFDVPFKVQTLSLSPHGRLAAVVGAPDGATRADNTPRRFRIVGARGTLTSIEADDLVFVDDTLALTLTVREGTADIGEVDVASGTRNWSVQVARMRSGTLSYSAAMNVWSLAGRDSDGRLTRASGVVGSSEVRSATWPVPAGAEKIDAWAATGTSTMAVQNHAERQIDARRWWVRGYGQPIALTMVSTTCEADPASQRRLLCTSWDGSLTRIYALDVEIGVAGGAGGVSSIDGQFRMDEQAAPGWVIGSLDGVPAAMRLATAELIQPPRPDDDEPPSMLTVSGSMLATVAASESGSRIRVYRLNP